MGPALSGSLGADHVSRYASHPLVQACRFIDANPKRCSIPQRTVENGTSTWCMVLWPDRNPIRSGDGVVVSGASFDEVLLRMGTLLGSSGLADQRAMERAIIRDHPEAVGEIPVQLTLDHPPSPPPPVTEAQARDASLDALEKWRADAIALARVTATRIDHDLGRVTSTEVEFAMREQGHGPMLDSIDPRWMGAVFRRGWRRIGQEPTGSHKRMVAIWTKEKG